MKRLYSEQFYAPDLEAARAALHAYIDYRSGQDGTSSALIQKLNVQPKAGQWPARLLLEADEVTAILNGIAVLDADQKIRLHGPNGDSGEKFAMLQSRLMHDIGERK